MPFIITNNCLSKLKQSVNVINNSAVWRVVGDVRRRDGSVPGGPGPAAVAKPRARADAVSADGAAPGARRGRTHAAAHALAPAHATHATARTSADAHEGI